MTLGEEIQLWDKRENDELGKLINFAYDETKDILTYVDMFGIEHNPIKSVLDAYAIDGNAKCSLKNLKNILYIYDICNFDDVEHSNNLELAKKILEFEKSLK